MSTVRYSLSGAALALAALIAGSAALLAPAALQAAPSKPALQSAAVKAPVPAKAEREQVATRGAMAARDRKPAEKGAQLAAANEPQYTSSLAGAQAEDDNCQRVRRKLWVDGEGWIVRRVPICH